jgi:hypothetical protein
MGKTGNGKRDLSTTLGNVTHELSKINPQSWVKFTIG